MQTGQSTPEHTSEMGDDALLAAIQQRDDAALAELYDRYGRLAFNLAYRILGERGIAEDVVQEAYLAVWRRATTYQPDRGSGRAWLMTIVHNQAIDRRRGRYKRQQSDVQFNEVVFRLETDAEDTFATVAKRLDAGQVRQALTSLPDEQRQTIELAYLGGLTHQEVAERTGTPLGTVKSRMRLGLQKMRTTLSDVMAPPDQPSQPATEGGPGQQSATTRDGDQD